MSVNGPRNSICDTVLDSNDTSGHQGMNNVDSALTTLISKLHNELKKYGDSDTRRECNALLRRLTDIKNLMLVQSGKPLVM
jgi:hypothetical protein